MQITQVTIYAIQALQELQKSKDPLSADDIARRLDISLEYAQKTIRAVRLAGLINSQNRSGYVLTKSLDKATLIELLESTDKGRAGKGVLADLEGETKSMLAVRHRLKDQLIKKGLGATIASAMNHLSHHAND